MKASHYSLIVNSSFISRSTLTFASTTSRPISGSFCPSPPSSCPSSLAAQTTSKAYIDALNQSPVVLAKTLLYLSKNRDEFSAYLAWRSRYSLVVNEWPCFLCKALTEKLSRKSSNNEGSVQLAQEGLCTSWPHLNFAENLSES